MNYTGKLYGKLGELYFDTDKTSDDWDAMETKLSDQGDVWTKQDVINAWNSAYGGDSFSSGEDYADSLLQPSPLKGTEDKEVK